MVFPKTLGMAPVDKDEFDGASDETGGAPFPLHHSEFAGTKKATAASFSLQDFDAPIVELRGRGITFAGFDFDDFKTEEGVLTLRDGRRGADFENSEGNILNIISELPLSPTSRSRCTPRNRAAETDIQRSPRCQ